MKVKFWVLVDEDSEAQGLSYFADYGEDDSSFIADLLGKRETVYLKNLLHGDLKNGGCH